MTEEIVMPKLNKAVARKVLKTVDAGLVSGMGQPIPGQMCVEAAVCYALGLPHSDEPICVGTAVRQFKIRLNDSNWPSDAARTAGMRKLAIAQLGSNEIDQWEFANFVALECQRRVLPITLRYAASFGGKDAADLEAAAVLCEASKNLEEAKIATLNAKEVTNRAYAYANANANAYSYAYAYANANAYSYAYANANDYAYANAYAYAYAYANAYSYAYANAKINLECLNLIAQIGLEALIHLKSPGTKWLDICEVPVKPKKAD